MPINEPDYQNAGYSYVYPSVDAAATVHATRAEALNQALEVHRVQAQCDLTGRYGADDVLASARKFLDFLEGTSTDASSASPNMEGN